jgi:flagellar biosynthesis protein FlhF
MHIKRFEAASMEQALSQVKAELGPDALILSSRTLRKGRSVFGLMARETVEIQAAIERRPATRSQAESRRGESEAPQQATAATRSADRDLETLIAQLRGELASIRRRPDFEEEIRGELRGLRFALGSALRSAGDQALEPSVAKLLGWGLEWKHAEAIATKWRAEAVAGNQTSLEAVLKDRIEAALTPPRVSQTPGIRVLVGAPGVGKTTTLAKLAARNEEGEGEVALVSMDPYRIGAQDQLRRYAELLDSPFCEVSRAGELPALAARHPRHQILVDTAGRGRQREDRLEPLDDLRGRLGRPVSIELVVDATARLEIQQAQLARFAPLSLDRIIFSKIDECDGLEAPLNLLLSPGCPPLSWLANGQRVPEDLVVAEHGFFNVSKLGHAA